MRAGSEGDRETFLAVVLISALEDAVTDWATVGPVVTGNSSPHGGTNAEATLYVPDGRGMSENHRVSPQTIAKGYDVLMRQERIEQVPNRQRDRLIEARASNDASALDSWDGDTLVQLGLFGRIEF